MAATRASQATITRHQIDDRGESGIQSAIGIIARMTHRDFCALANDLGIPEQAYNESFVVPKTPAKRWGFSFLPASR